MAIKRQSDLRKGNRRQNNRRNIDIKIIKIQGEEDQEQDVIVRRATALQKEEKSTWSWHEEFVLEWTETFITKKKKRPNKEER